MKISLCRKMAFGNIGKNYRFFVPRILTETGLLACFYIIYTLACDDRLSSVKGGSYLPTFMWMGAVIIGLLSFILLLYTNSCLMKQRKHEFGLYSVLGMEKKHICRILLHESLACAAASVSLGLISGMVFYKLCSLAICKLLKAEIVAGFYFISPRTVIPAGAIFIGIDIFTYIVNCISIGRLKPVELLSSKSASEKEPKVKWLLLVLGVLTLGAGYYISLTVKDPLDAILLFFAAVLLVIAGTYFLFTSGSIFVLKFLKRKDGYYYKPGRMTAVSGLLYRMKQNAVGLASVAILATGVLVMISTTFCLYSRTETILDRNYPEDLYVPTVYYDDHGFPADIPDSFICDTVDICASRYDLDVKNTVLQKYFEVSFIHRNGKLISERDFSIPENDYADLCNITFITEEMYVSLGGSPLGLRKNEVAVCPYNINASFGDSTFELFGNTYRVTETLTHFPIHSVLISVNCFGMVVADDDVFDDIYNGQKAAYGDNASLLQRSFCISFTDRSKTLKVGDAFLTDLRRELFEYMRENSEGGFSYYDLKSYWETRDNLYGMYGTLLFLGILLGIVCLFATVLIIYYKQISEGYEDRQRYQIMQKIGMTDREVKKTIRSQIMLVFFLPLVTAGIHIAFAYPILTKLLEVLLLDDKWLFAKWCVIVYIAFALVYVLIYKLTAKTYYKIVY